MRQQQESMRKQEQLLEQQLNEARVSTAAMKEQNRVARERSEKAMSEAEERRKVSEENLQIKQAKTEAIQTKVASKISDKTRGRAGLKIEKSSPVSSFSNPIESLVNLPV
jgi:hypothetical protein